MRFRYAVGSMLAVALASCAPEADSEEKVLAIAAFDTVRQVFQHPRCQNCHIPGDAPLQYDGGTPHTMGVTRGSDGHGAPGLPCSTCHGDKNLPASYGPSAPPGAPHWALPPADHKMAWIGLPPGELCRLIKNKKENGGRDLEALTTHVSADSLVLWGWSPGGNRAPVHIPHDKFVASFTRWSAAGAPCPATP
ncbi:MAG TPA: hypothetical protein VJ817_08255 [Gemmatimonadales bacterium]|nr:hypothetical protein [Gemmatimonadales bacterium]